MKVIFGTRKIKYFVEKKGANPNIQNQRDSYSALMYIVWLCDDDKKTEGLLYDRVLNTYRYLLSLEDIDVNLTDVGGNRLIHHVVRKRTAKFLHILLEKRCVCRDIDVLNVEMDNSPLHIASSCNKYIPVETIYLLLKAGADPNLRCRYSGMTPLHYVMDAYNDNGGEMMTKMSVECEDKLCEILWVFLQFPRTRLGDVHLRDKRGRTVLHYAARYVRSRTVIDILLNRGEYQSLSRTDNYHFTPNDDAIGAGNHDAIFAFQRYNMVAKFGLSQIRSAG
jgi:ankyrin repeat protein